MAFKPATSPILVCKKCWEEIVLVRSRKSRSWITCDPGMRAAADGRVTVTLDGRMIRGAGDVAGVEGLEPHYAKCRAVILERRRQLGTAERVGAGGGE